MKQVFGNIVNDICRGKNEIEIMDSYDNWVDFFARRFNCHSKSAFVNMIQELKTIGNFSGLSSEMKFHLHSCISVTTYIETMYFQFGYASGKSISESEEFSHVETESYLAFKKSLRVG